ncbi:MAG TPA: hypothetical protein VGF29_11335 [Hyphomicrobiaceae bacterium]
MRVLPILGVVLLMAATQFPTAVEAAERAAKREAGVDKIGTGLTRNLNPAPGSSAIIMILGDVNKKNAEENVAKKEKPQQRRNNRCVLKPC